MTTGGSGRRSDGRGGRRLLRGLLLRPTDDADPDDDRRTDVLHLLGRIDRQVGLEHLLQERDANLGRHALGLAGVDDRLERLREADDRATVAHRRAEVTDLDAVALGAGFAQGERETAHVQVGRQGVIAHEGRDVRLRALHALADLAQEADTVGGEVDVAARAESTDETVQVVVVVGDTDPILAELDHTVLHLHGLEELDLTGNELESFLFHRTFLTSKAMTTFFRRTPFVTLVSSL